MKIVLVTGGFDPCHSGHLAYFQSAKKLGDRLIVGLNSDEWLTRKKGRPFMPMSERFALVSALSIVDEVVVYNDDDGSSCDAISLVKTRYPNDQVVFANGGDRTKDNIPEMVFDDVEFAFGIGGINKINSSSWILEDWKKPKTTRAWGYYRVLHEVDGTKVKELTVEPKQSLSMQKHLHRSEYWIVTEGKCKIYGYNETGELTETLLNKHDTISIKIDEWHQLSNSFDEPCKIVEIQYGEKCIEEDIKRENA